MMTIVILKMIKNLGSTWKACSFWWLKNLKKKIIIFLFRTKSATKWALDELLNLVTELHRRIWSLKKGINVLINLAVNLAVWKIMRHVKCKYRENFFLPLSYIHSFKSDDEWNTFNSCDTPFREMPVFSSSHSSNNQSDSLIFFLTSQFYPG